MSQKWSISFIITVTVIIAILVVDVVVVDPFFQYHQPNNFFRYDLKSEKKYELYQNPGILKTFSYDAIISGSSMCENFEVSEFDNVFEAEAVKVAQSGGSLKEINDLLSVGFQQNDNINIVVRSVDYSLIVQDKDYTRTEESGIPFYLYTSTKSDDVEYLLNMDSILSSIDAVLEGLDGRNGITDFDTYENWNATVPFGKEYVMKDYDDMLHNMSSSFGINYDKNALYFNDIEIQKITENIQVNVCEMAERNPNTTFICFFPPYSIAYWKCLMKRNEYDKMIQAEEIAIKLMLKHDNILLFSFNTYEDLVTDFDRYKDIAHYDEDVNSFMLNEFSLGANSEFNINMDNYPNYLSNEKELHRRFDF